MGRLPITVEVVRTTVPGASSSYDERSSETVQRALSASVQDVRVTVVNTMDDLEALVARNPDLVWNGFAGNPIVPSFTAYLEESGQSFVGSTQEAMRLTHHKDLGKRAVAAAGLRTAAFFTAEPGRYTSPAALPIDLPLFVKPPRHGAGAGIDDRSVVRSFEEYESKLMQIADEFSTYALVEEYLPGREFTVAVVQVPGARELMTNPVELVTARNRRGDRILGAEVKRADEEEIVAILEPEVRAAVVEIARAAFPVLGARDYGRIDIRMNSDGCPCFLEANLMPGPTPIGYFARACQLVAGLECEAALSLVFENALSRA